MTASPRAAFLLAALLTAGCTRPFRCERETLEATLPATLEREGRSATVTLFDGLGPANLPPPRFEEVADAVLRGRGRAGTAVTWAVSSHDAAPITVAALTKAQLAPGEVLPIAMTFSGGGWGVVRLPDGASAQLGVRVPGFEATAATGSATVLAVAPLRLRLDVTATDAAGATLRLRGDVSFNLRRESGPCFT